MNALSIWKFEVFDGRFSTECMLPKSRCFCTGFSNVSFVHCQHLFQWRYLGLRAVSHFIFARMDCRSLWIRVCVFSSVIDCILLLQFTLFRTRMLIWFLILHVFTCALGWYQSGWASRLKATEMSTTTNYAFPLEIWASNEAMSWDMIRRTSCASTW